MKKVGITGGIASGKSVVSRILEVSGYPVFYSDSAAKQVVNESAELKLSISELLGKEAYAGDKLDAAYVASIVFHNPALLESLNKIIHPVVRQKFQEWTEDQDSDLVFNEAAILFETGGYLNFDATILVTAPLELRIERAAKRDRSEREEVIKRINRQWTDEQKIPLATYVINNDDRTPVIDQIESILYSLS